MLISSSVRRMRTAISPRLATSTFLNMPGSGHYTSGPANATEQMPGEHRVLVQLLAVPERGVPGAAAFKLVVPGDRVIRAHGVGTGLVAGLVERHEDVDGRARI